METKELDFEIAKGQIAFSFDDIKIEENEEESSLILPEKLKKAENNEWIAEEVLFVVVKAQNKFLSNDLPSLNLCGKKMLDWVRIAGGACKQAVIEDCEDIMGSVRQIQTDKKYIAVFYSDTPLFHNGAFCRIMNYFSSKNANYLQLKRGFVVKTEFLKNCSVFMQGSAEKKEEDALLQATTPQIISFMHKFINERILAYHENNGVTILGRETVFIDADVEIENGVVIYPNNVVKGESIIAGGTVLLSGNVIENSIISNNCIISASYIDKSKISQGKELKAEKIIEKEI